MRLPTIKQTTPYSSAVPEDMVANDALQTRTVWSLVSQVRGVPYGPVVAHDGRDWAHEVLEASATPSGDVDLPLVGRRNAILANASEIGSCRQPYASGL